MEISVVISLVEGPSSIPSLSAKSGGPIVHSIEKVKSGGLIVHSIEKVKRGGPSVHSFIEQVKRGASPSSIPSLRK